MFKMFVLSISLLFAAFLYRVYAPASKLSRAAPPRHDVAEVLAKADLVVQAAPAASSQSESLPNREERSIAPVPARATLRIGWNANPPRKYFDDSGTPRGIVADILTAVSQRVNLDLKFVSCVLAQCLEQIKAGSLDAVAEAVKNPERETFLEYLSPEMPVAVARVFYQRVEDERRLDEVQDLNGMMIGSIKDQNLLATFAPSHHVKKIEFAGGDSLIAALLDQKIDSFVAIEDPTDFRIAQKGLSHKLKKAGLAQRESLLVHFLAIGKNSALLAKRQELEDALSAMLLAGEIASISTTGRQRFAVGGSLPPKL